MPHLGLLILAYYCVLIFSRVLALGWHYGCDAYWGCNVSLLFASIGYIQGWPLLIGTAACIVCVDQLCWYIDFLLYPATGKFVIGVAKYLVSPETSVIHVATSTHHVWFLPLLAWSLRAWGIAIPCQSYACSVIITAVLACAARAATPFHVRERDGSVKYFNINLAYAFWRDIHISPLHALDHAPAFAYVPWIIALCNVLNFVPCLALERLFSYVTPPSDISFAGYIGAALLE